MGFLKEYIGKYGKSFFIAVFFVMLETVCDLLLPTIMSQIIDVGIADKNMDYVFSKGTLMIFITALGAVAASVRNVISSNVSQKFGAELRTDVYKKIQSFSFEQINKFDTASLITRLTNDVLQIQALVNGLMRIFIKGPFLCIGSLIMATRLNYNLATVLAVVVPIVGVLIIINMKIGFPFFTKVQQALDKVNSVIREYLSGVRVVKAFNRFDYEVERFNKANKEFQSRSVQGLRVMALFGPCIMLTVNFGIVSVLWFGGIRVNIGEMQAGHIIAFINYMTQILFSLLLISMIFNMFVKAKASAERISEVITQESNIIGEIHHERQSDIKGRIDFENVFFSYEGVLGQFILKDINLTCMPGETIGIIGATGSGKSSLINLIPRFYDVTLGCIRVDGEDVKSVNPKRIRDKVAVVPQKTVLFTGTVMENIRWGKEDATMEEIQKAAMIAEAHDFISASPEGYQTRLGQGGVNFSGGQKQRISIARALVRKPEILILDDSTSAVDVVTERKIKKSLEKYAKDLTCVIIAQRISSVIDADKIVVLEEGKIISIGKHNELLKTCQVYREIFQSQLGKEM
ncbi:ABC transporter ATP-binding protein [Pelosinus sp. IPA-1]|uniref:ABC transporter ATP-binding protein n=1 Tax=Pelosinus sp. IPA-1 TaxID=3029569 RepID=UPI0024362656|nr:ABC transporter ATP-binding protein [Pelosinus sp. IPA-1]GMB00576.1 ABC transporter [Pelosinus sp. IPA-1]